MEQPYPTTLTEAMEKAAQGLRVTAEGIESAAKEIKAIENPVPPNALKQLDRIEQLLKEKIPSDLPEKLQMIDKLIKLIPVDLDKQLERLQTGFRGLNRETDKQGPQQRFPHVQLPPLRRWPVEAFTQHQR
ncbi:hypothetical protein B9Z19DRAFT_4120 [Tuber borchii]|uniref:Uncharacterized protein n=1 Tax=Tuber borchii TaxID=42251 RepID=A0A2T7A9G0_TUBBO|nr:hypothetical protein B9Z19DRAFT_4120 [Tuber borchii]